MIRFIASLLCHAITGLTFGLLIANLADAGDPPPDPHANLRAPL